VYIEIFPETSVNIRLQYAVFFIKYDLLRLKFLQVHVGYTNCSDNQFTTVFLDAFHVGVL